MKARGLRAPVNKVPENGVGRGARSLGPLRFRPWLVSFTIIRREIKNIRAS